MSRDEPPDESEAASTSIDGFLRDMAHAPAVALPETIGRYRIQRRLGAGGMGVVYAAHDPRLDRPVAIKVLRERAGAGAELGERLEREAQALARISHPNVVSVFDVGVEDGAVHIVMQRVEGTTLDVALDERPRTPAEVVGLFVAAGRGLAAVHAVGMVHRDVKPSNMLVDGDGQVRITDFGLALLSDAGDAGDAEGEGSPRLTQTGAVMGTPAYMAPEQHRGEAVGPAADQFGFCASLWQALTGALPFPGTARAEIAAGIEHDTPTPGPDAAAVPPWMLEVVGRGLARDPAARWPSMPALLAALSADPVARRRRRVRQAALGVAGAGLIAAVVVLATRTPGAARPSCDGGAAQIATTWSPARADALRASFAATGLPYAPALAERVVLGLDGRAAQWTAAHRSACLATRDTGEQSEELLDRRMSCLDRRLAELDALAGALVAVGPEDRARIDQAIQAVAALPGLDACADVARLAEITPPPADPTARARVDALFREIAAVAPSDASMLAPSVIEAGLARLRALEPEVAALAHPPLAVALQQGIAELSPPTEAEAHLTAALAAAAAAHDDVAAAEIWTDLVRLIGVDLHRHDESALIQSTAATASARAGVGLDDDFTLLDRLSEVANDSGDYALARDLAARALAAAERSFGPDDPGLVYYVADMATAERFAGHHDEALALQRRAAELSTRALGADHPATIYVQSLLATLLGFVGSTEEALAVAQELRARAPRVLGADHQYTGVTMVVLAQILTLIGRHAESLIEFQSAIPILERAFGVDHIETVNVRSELASELDHLGRHDEAMVEFREVLAGLERALGPDHPRVGTALLDLGGRLGGSAEARQMVERAAHIYETRLGPEHRNMATALEALAELERAEGHSAAAVPLNERAIAIADKNYGPAHPRSAVARFNLAIALWDIGEKARSRALAKEVLATMRAAGSDGEPWAVQVEAWLEERR